MNSDHSGQTKSAWISEALPNSGPLGQDLSAEICVVGAGIAGLSVAYQLCSVGKRVVVLDGRPPGSGETERTTAHLSFALDDRIANLERIHGLEHARLAVESHKAAIDEIEAIARQEEIDCDFKRLNGYLFSPPGGSPRVLQEELEAAHRVGLGDIVFIPRAPLRDFDTGRCLVFKNQGQFHPLKFMSGLRSAILRRGGALFTDRAIGFESGSPARVKTGSGHAVQCQAIAVCSNSPVNDWMKIHSKQAPYRTYAIGLGVERDSIPEGLYWDTAQDAESERSESLTAPYHYVRLQSEAETDILIVGGEDHKTGQANDGQARWARLEGWARERFPRAGEVLYRWSGQVMEPVDGLAYIGRNPGEKNIYIATGDSGHGITHGTIAGLLIRDLVLERPTAWAKVYDPARKAVISKSTYLEENINVAGKYMEYVTAGEIHSAETLNLNSGAILRRGLKKIAAYKAPDGTVHEFSAVCPHLKCIVHWNGAEKSWDCPCHGSRFTPYGEVLNGPAISGLQQIDIAKEEREAA